MTDALTVDISVKVTSLRVRIPKPSSKGLDGVALLVDEEVGFIAAGDVATTLPVRESLRAAMSRLWINPSLVIELSMLSIAQVSAEILHRLWRRRSAMDVEPVFATVCLVGWCPREKRGRAFVLEPRVSGDVTRVDVGEIQPSQGPIYFGSGARVARELAASQPHLTPPQIIREVVSRGLDPSVGGRVQYGKLDGTEFEVYAVYDFDVHEEGKTLTSGYYIGGVELLAQADLLSLPDGYMLLPHRVVTPFMDEQAAAIAQGFNPVTSDAHFPTLIGRREIQ